MSRSVVAAVLCVLLPGASVLGEPGPEAARDTVAYRLQEVVIYGPHSAPASSMVTEIPATEISRRGAITVADAVRFDPGLAVSSGPKAETETKIRGFPARSVLVLVDGRPMNPGYYGKVDLAMLPVDHIAKVKVVKGPASVAYGPNGMGGVINVVTRSGLERPQTVLSGEAGDFRYRKLSVNHSRRVGRYNYWVSGYETHSDGYRLSGDFEETSQEDGGLRRNSFYHKAGFDSKVGRESLRGDLYALSLGYHWAEKEVPSTIYSWDSPNFRAFPSYERINTALSGQTRLGSDADLKTVFYVDAYHDRLVDYQTAELADDEVLWDSKLENWTVGGSADVRWSRGGSHQWRGGLSFKRDLMNKKPDLDESWQTHTIYTGNLFLEDAVRLSAKTQVTIGAAYSGYESEQAGSFAGKLGPMVSVHRELPQGFRARASYAGTIRFPTLHRLYSESSGNPDLKPEEAEKFEIGLARAFRGRNENWFANLEAAFFHNDLKNLIYRAGRGYVFQNVGSATLQGWELSADVGLSRYVRAQSGFARLDPDRSTAELLEEVSPNQFRLALSILPRVGSELRYELNTFDYRSTYVVDRRLDPYETHDVRVSQTIGRHVRVHAMLRNLTDVNYEEELGYPGPGRQLTGGLTVTP